jgi:RNA polymerase sigma-70 factor (ECF subfamily)
MIAKDTLIQLVKACQRGEEKAQAAFYAHYKRRMMGICRRYARTTFEAEDIFQEAFIKVFLKIGTVQDPGAIDFWIKSLMTRTAIDHYRKNSPYWLSEDADKPGVLPDESDPFDVLGFLEQQEIIQVISALPDGYRMVVNLYLIDGYEHHEIAELLGISAGTSKSQLSRAKAHLRKILQEKGITTENAHEKG